MPSQTGRSWTLCGLIGAFIDLFLAYFLLCGSAFVFFVSKFCKFFGIYLPCPCTGVLGYLNGDLCWHKLFIDEPIRRIASVQMLIKINSLFDLIWFRQQPGNLETMLRADKSSCNEVVELDNEASSSSFTIRKPHNLADEENGVENKGKKIVNQKQRYRTRPRKRSTPGYRKFQLQSVVAGSDIRSQSGDCLGPAVNGMEDGLQDNHNAANGLDLGERPWQSFDKSDIDSSFIEKFVCTSQANAGNDISVIRMLEEALETEKTACAVLHSELEKERAAAATAADEAMAMILRLQEDKAAIEMEARQYHWMIEETFAHQEEEMNILKEILVRRERENHFLEKELEAYKQIKCMGNVQPEDDWSHIAREWEEKPLFPLDWNSDTPLVLQETENSKSVSEKKAESNTNLSSTYKAASAETTAEAAQTCSDMKNNMKDELNKDKVPGTEVSSNLHRSMLDLEPIVYDVHVIDDKTSECRSVSRVETNQDNHRSSIEFENRVPLLRDSQSKSLPSDSARSSSPAAVCERLKIDTEIELLREKLKRVQEEKLKLTFPTEYRETVNTQLKLVGEILNHLLEIQQLRKPVQRTSLPPKSSKVSLRKRRCRSASVEFHESSS